MLVIFEGSLFVRGTPRKLTCDGMHKPPHVRIGFFDLVESVLVLTITGDSSFRDFLFHIKWKWNTLLPV